MAETLSGLGDAGAAGTAAVSSTASETGTRRLSDLRVIDLRAELRKRNLDSSGNKSVLMERLKKVRFAGTPRSPWRHPPPGPERPVASVPRAHTRAPRAPGVSVRIPIPQRCDQREITPRAGSGDR